MRLQFGEDALQELHAATAYLEEQHPGSGQQFLAHVEAALEMIEARPGSWRPLGPGLHCYRIKRFRYSLIYRIHKRRPQIIAVAHDRQRPGYWLQRVD